MLKELEAAIHSLSKEGKSVTEIILSNNRFMKLCKGEHETLLPDGIPYFKLNNTLFLRDIDRLTDKELTDDEFVLITND